jgi:hypothetical protein
MSMCLHGFCKITSRKLFNKSFLGRSHMGTLGAKTSLWRVPPLSGTQDTCPTCHTLDTPLTPMSKTKM